MISVIAFCTDADVFNNNQIFNKDFAKMYPGSGWLQALAKLAEKYNVEVVTGDIAIKNIQKGKWESSEVLIIQEENALHGSKLKQMGAVPFVLVCLESPLFVSDFYALYEEKYSEFKNKILFRGAFKNKLDLNYHSVVFFPSFEMKELGEVVPWNKRKFLVMVAGNKYWKIKRPFYRQILASIRDFLLQKKSYLTSEIMNAQLHDKRLELIEYFGDRNLLDLYGRGWTDLSNLPTAWQKRLEQIVLKLKPMPCHDKQEIISYYKFALCFENMSYPGYVTEKIIDCLVMGVVPIYIGAPDISDFIPKNLFIHLDDFNDYDKLEKFIQSITAEVANEMIVAGRKFLESKEGYNYSYEGFATNIIEKVKDFKKLC